MMAGISSSITDCSIFLGSAPRGIVKSFIPIPFDISPGSHFAIYRKMGGPSTFAPAVLALSAVAPLLQLKGKNYLARSKARAEQFYGGMAILAIFSWASSPCHDELNILKVAKASKNNYHSTCS
jgi:hypothetical protein